MWATLEIPSIEDQRSFNVRRWKEISQDPVIGALDHRIETDRFGQIIMTSPPGFDHGNRQFDIGYHLKKLLVDGTVVTECPISTSDGVKAADVIWISNERLKTAREGNLLVVAPEICVEVLSPSNTLDEINEKKRLYFSAGAEEVWMCDLEGAMHIFLKSESGVAVTASLLCSNFPRKSWQSIASHVSIISD